VAFFLCPPFSDSPHDGRVRSIEDYHRQPAISAVPDFRHQSDQFPKPCRHPERSEGSRDLTPRSNPSDLLTQTVVFVPNLSGTFHASKIVLHYKSNTKNIKTWNQESKPKPETPKDQEPKPSPSGSASASAR
jgi:hypothetical protein